MEQNQGENTIQKEVRRVSYATKPKPLDFNPDVYLGDNYLVLDFETTNKDYGSPATKDNRIVCAAWYRGPIFLPGSRKQKEVCCTFGDEYHQRELCEAIAESDFIIAYNAKFECGWLKRCGIELRDLIVYDPMLAEYCLYGNLKPDGGFSLDSTLSRYGIPGKMRYVSALIEAGVNPSDIPQNEVREYCICDVRRTHDLFIRQRQEVFRRRLQRVVYGRCLQSPMLADVESRGVQLDEQRVQSNSRSTIQLWNRYDRELQEFTGAVNWRSPKQVCALVYDKLKFEELRDYLGNPIRTETGGRSAREETISLLVARTDAQRKFKVLWNKLAPLKREMSVLESMRGACKDDLGQIYASFNQAVTQNHRLSSSGGKWGFQFQNFPRTLKSLFRARERGWVIIEGDCPQLEFRVAAELASDQTALGDILARADIHSLTSAVTGFNRQDAKPHTFKPLYGGRSGPTRLRRYYDAFRKRYNRIYDTQMGWVYTVLEHKKLTIPTGLVFSWPDTEVTSSGYITNTPSIFNYPISCFATADISQLSMLLFWHSLRGMGAYLVNTVHDSNIGECPEEEACKYKQLMVQSYTQDIYNCLESLYNYDFNAPLGVGIKAAEFWGDTKNEEKFESERFKFTSDQPTRIVLQ